MNILLTNDDGWDALGLQSLQSVAGQFGDVWTVAPLEPMSGISHQLTFERPMTLAETAERSFSLDGTPADCVRIATTQLGIDFDWVLSGINNGGNLGSDIFVSGTVAAAREAALGGQRSLALSQHRKKFLAPFDWTRTKWMAESVLNRFLGQPDQVSRGTAINVNFPDRFQDAEHPNLCQEEFQQTLKIVDCERDANPIPAKFLIDEQGRYLYCGIYNDRARIDGSDIAVCFSGAVAISVLNF